VIDASPSPRAETDGFRDHTGLSRPHVRRPLQIDGEAERVPERSVDF
jgi:hypothetical protein